MKQTPLHAAHLRLGAKMAPFAGFDMPIQYTGIRVEHEAVRRQAGLFDVSHMGNFLVSGPGARAFLQYLTTNDVAALRPGQVQYSALCLPDGGVIDDILVGASAPDAYRVVVNASNVDKDWEWFQSHRGSGDFDLVNASADTAILSVQGPQAENILRQVAPQLPPLPTYHCGSTRVVGVETPLSRTGYTGEDGFELFPEAGQAAALWDALLAAGAPFGMRPVGLGARDTLRLEAGYSLYGHELNAGINPLEAGLSWITAMDKGDFLGRDALVKIKQPGLARKMTGLEMEELAIPREGCEVRHAGRVVGRITSGTLSPTLGKGIALALIEAASAVRGTELQIDIRGVWKKARAVPRNFYRRDRVPQEKPT